MKTMVRCYDVKGNFVATREAEVKVHEGPCFNMKCKGCLYNFGECFLGLDQARCRSRLIVETK
jgi:hypothetical protein